METGETIISSTNPVLLCILLLSGMLILLRLGNIFGHRLHKIKDDENNAINITFVAAVLGLFALLLGFTFSMGGARLETRRANTINEANAIGTAILRADFYPKEVREAFRLDFKEYTQARVNYFKAGSNMKAMHQADLEAEASAARLWNRASTDAINTTSLFPGNLMLPALNEMIDSSNTTNYGEKFRVPDLIVILLFTFSLACAFFLGYYIKTRGLFDSTITVGFCLLSALVIYTTLDMDRSRTGLIQQHASLQALSDVLQQFDKP
jgi:hypothetical protein